MLCQAVPTDVPDAHAGVVGARGQQCGVVLRKGHVKDGLCVPCLRAPCRAAALQVKRGHLGWAAWTACLSASVISSDHTLTPG